VSIDSLDSDDDQEMLMMVTLQEELEKEDEHVLNFSSIKARRVVPCDRIAGAHLFSMNTSNKTQHTLKVSFIDTIGEGKNCSCG